MRLTVTATRLLSGVGIFLEQHGKNVGITPVYVSERTASIPIGGCAPTGGPTVGARFGLVV